MEVVERDIINLMAHAWDLESEGIPLDVQFNRFPAWDSAGHVSLLVALEKEYSVEINYDMLVELVDVSKILAYLRNKIYAG